MGAGDPATRPPVVYRDRVRPEWVDYNGHMSEAYYVLVFGYATDAFYDLIGMTDDYRRRQSRSVYTLESHTSFVEEVGEGAPLTVRSQVLGHDHKRVQLFHAMHRGDAGVLLATTELMLLHVDMAAKRATPFDSGIQARLHGIAEAHARFATPKQAGRTIRL